MYKAKLCGSDVNVVTFFVGQRLPLQVIWLAISPPIAYLEKEAQFLRVHVRVTSTLLVP